LSRTADESPTSRDQGPGALVASVTAARSQIANVLQDGSRLTAQKTVALRSALRLLDAVAEHSAPGLHAEALQVALEAIGDTRASEETSNVAAAPFT
jgi:hypothetical protein